jgi:hypothetical protein
MGIVWREGSLYPTSGGAVFWLRLKNRPANNFVSMYTAAHLRFFPTQINNPDLPLETPDPDPAWAAYGDVRSVAWNGGKADGP